MLFTQKIFIELKHPKTNTSNMRQLKITKQVTNRESISLDKYLQEVSRIELLTHEEEISLAQRIRNNDMEALNIFIRANLRFVISVAKQYQHQGLSLPDLINEGNIGLIKAARRFDETKGFKFISYAVWWIRQSILQAIAEYSRIVRLPLNKLGSIKKINQAFIKLEQSFERTPSPEEIAKALDLAPSEVRDAITVSHKTISMDATLSNDDDNSTLHDLIRNKEPYNTDNKLLKESLQQEIEIILNALPKREADIIRYYFGLNNKSPMTLEEIGATMGLTRERVRQIKSKTINLLRMKSKILKTYL